jgi:hypothetical protein
MSALRIQTHRALAVWRRSHLYSVFLLDQIPGAVSLPIFPSSTPRRSLTWAEKLTSPPPLRSWHRRRLLYMYRTSLAVPLPIVPSQKTTFTDVLSVSREPLMEYRKVRSGLGLSSVSREYISFFSPQVAGLPTKPSGVRQYHFTFPRPKQACRLGSRPE